MKEQAPRAPGSAPLDDEGHLRAAHRAGALKGRAAIGQGNRLGTADFSIVPAAHAETFPLAPSFCAKKRTGAPVGAFYFGPARGPLDWVRAGLKTLGKEFRREGRDHLGSLEPPRLRLPVQALGEQPESLQPLRVIPGAMASCLAA